MCCQTPLFDSRAVVSTTPPLAPRLFSMLAPPKIVLSCCSPMPIRRSPLLALPSDSPRHPLPSALRSSQLCSILRARSVIRPSIVAGSGCDICGPLEHDVPRVREEGKEEGSHQQMPEAQGDGHSMNVGNGKVGKIRHGAFVVVPDDEFGDGQLHRPDAHDYARDVRWLGCVSGPRLVFLLGRPHYAGQRVDVDSHANAERGGGRDYNVKVDVLKDSGASWEEGWGSASL